MRSLQQRLALGLALGLALLFLAGGLVLERLTRDAVWGALDASLDAEARRFAAALRTEVDAEQGAAFTRLGAEVLRELEDAGPAVEERRRRLRDLAARHLHVRLADAPWSAGDEATEALYTIDIRTGDGREVAHRRGSGSLTPDGRRSRVMRLHVEDVPFENAAWQRSWTQLRARLGIAPTAATVRVATDSEEQHELLIGLQTALILCGTLLVAAAAALAWLVTRRSLAPLRELRRQVESLSAATLGQGVAIPRPVAELVPIVDTLNEALGKLDEAFAREKRMTSDLAHELRTPVAELKSVTDVAAQWPDDAALQARSVEQCRAIAERMTGLVGTLLHLAHVRTGQAEPDRRAVDLAAQVQAAWAPLAPQAAARALTFVPTAGPAHDVVSDPDIVATILSNLLGNAVEHAPAGGRIEAALRTAADGTTLTLRNPAGDLAPEDARRATEPFWRGERSRTGREHRGLGLSLVAEFARAAGLGFQVSVDGGVFEAALTFPPTVA